MNDFMKFLDGKKSFLGVLALLFLDVGGTREWITVETVDMLMPFAKALFAGGVVHKLAKAGK